MICQKIIFISDSVQVGFGSFEPYRPAGALLRTCSKTPKLLIGQLGPPAHFGEQRAQFHPSRGADSGLRNLAHFGLHAVTAAGCPYAQGPVHLVGNVAAVSIAIFIARLRIQCKNLSLYRIDYEAVCAYPLSPVIASSTAPRVCATTAAFHSGVST
jgi:hypothetical protein